MATPLEAARALAYESQAAYDAGNYETASAQAEAAQRLVPAPTLALLEARAAKKLGHYLAARNSYRVAAAPLPSGASEAFVRAQQVAQGELSLLEAETPQIIVLLPSSLATRRDLSLDIDGIAWPEQAFGVPLPHDPGRHVVRVRGEGLERSYTVELVPRERRRVVVDEAPPPASPRIPIAVAALSVGALGMGLGLGLDAADPRGTSAGGAVAYVVGGLGLAAGGLVLVAWPAETEHADPQVAVAFGPGRLGISGTF